MSSSTSKRRPKSSSQNPNFKLHNAPPNHSPSTSSSSTITSLFAEVEPPPNLLPSKSEFLKLIVVIAIAVIVVTACNFLVEFFHPPSIPFCDSDVEYDDSRVGSCEPCPSNGRCYNGQLECIQGYKKYGKLCIEDGDINMTANRLSKQAKDIICGAYAQYMCGGTGKIWVSEINLKSMLQNDGLTRSSTMDNITCMYIQERALEYLSGLLDTRMTDDWIKEFKCPNHLAESYKPITCRICQWIAKHLLFLIPVCALVFNFQRQPLKHYLLQRTS
uniref:Man1/Src1 C-terminal domain-containing protein n=1 Tax=Opuntia streptacantha TaxID=393608 RepID=A0A7C9AJS5_OPUST